MDAAQKHNAEVLKNDPTLKKVRLFFFVLAEAVFTILAITWTVDYAANKIGRSFDTADLAVNLIVPMVVYAAALVFQYFRSKE